MPVKSESRSTNNKSSILQGRWGKSISPPGKQQSKQLKGNPIIYLGKSVAPPKQGMVQRKTETDSKTQVSMPSKVQQKMEGAFGTSFADVKVFKNSTQAKTLGAQAFTQGNEVHFAQGKFDPNTQQGQELLGHELTHVEQQRQGRVTPTKQAKGVAINDDASLEKEADVKGAKAAQGIAVNSATQTKQLKETGNQPVQRSIWSSIKKGVKKAGSAIASGAKKVGGAIASGAKKAWSGIKEAGGKAIEWLKDKADIIKWMASAGSFANSLWGLIKAKKWSDAYKLSKEGQKPPGMLAKLGAVVGLITGPITLGKSIINIVRASSNKKLVEEAKPAKTDKEKKAKENVNSIQNIRLAMAAGSATDGVLTIVSSIMTLAGAATAGIGAIFGLVIQAVQLIISGAKMIYNEYRKRSKDYKAKVAAENEETAEGMISLQDAKLYQAIGMKYDEGSGALSEDKEEKPQGIKDTMRIKLSDIKRSVKGEEKEQVDVDQTQQKAKIIEHLNKERDDAASA